MSDQEVGEKLAGLVEKKFDVFIAHASEDKTLVARPLAERLNKYGARVWYDEFILRPGDPLITRIDEGLARSSFGVLVVSPAFLGKPWTEYERQGLTGRDVLAGGGVLIPVWHGVTAEEVGEFSPTLAQRLALRTEDMDIDELALRVLERVRPELAEGPARLAAFERLLATAESPAESAPISTLRRSERRHESLPEPLVRRIRLIHGVFAEVLRRSWNDTLDDFMRDLHPEREVEIWESIAVNYLRILNSFTLKSAEAKKEVFGLLLAGTNGAIDSSDLVVHHIPAELATAIRDAFRKIREDATPSR